MVSLIHRMFLLDIQLRLLPNLEWMWLKPFIVLFTWGCLDMELCLNVHMSTQFHHLHAWIMSMHGNWQSLGNCVDMILPQLILTIEMFMKSSICPHLIMAMLCLCCPMWCHVFLSAYGCSMDGTDKECDGHPWCTTKTTNILNALGFSIRQSICANHLQCTKKYCDYLYDNGGVPNYTEWIGSTLVAFCMAMVAPKYKDWNVRYVVPHNCALHCVMLKNCLSILHLMRCSRHVYILVFTNTMFPTIHVASH